MFGYELADLFLFDISVLKESYSLYIGAHQLALYIGLAANIALIFFLKRALIVSQILVGLAWIYPAYFFYIARFSDIYWPAKYMGLIAITIGLLHFYFAAKNELLVIQKFNHYTFVRFTLLAAVISYILSPETPLCFGTSASVAALSSFCIHITQRNFVSRVIASFSLLWLTFIGIALWTLIFYV